ncbi:hypothetical protein LI177_13180 [bacterium 210820-DFI.6.37]|nr:hypothetical protein [bacterium 210820-DFI.6.37]
MKEQRRITALITAVFMLLALVIPAVSAAPVSAAADVTITKVQLVTPPNDPSVAISNDDYSYNLEGAELKVTYSNGNSETLEASGSYFNPCDLDLLPSDLEVEFSINMTAAKEGAFDAQILCEQWDDEGNELPTIKTTIALNGVPAKTVKSISLVSGPDKKEFLVGLDDRSIYKGIAVKLTYTDGTSDIAYCDSRGDFDLPSCLIGWHSMWVKETDLKVGQNTITIIYEDPDENQKTLTFQITASEYIAKEESLDTEKLTDATISSFGEIILNANNELWMTGNFDEEAELFYQKKTGIAKAYRHVYLETSGTGVILDGTGKTLGTYPQTKDCDENYLLLENGDLYSVWENRKVASDVIAWGGGLALKEDGRVQVLYVEDDEPEAYVSNAADIVDIQYSWPIDKNGTIYVLDSDWDDEGELQYSLKEFATNIEKMIGANFWMGKNGKTYYYGFANEDDDNPSSYAIFNQEAIAYKDIYIEDSEAKNTDSVGHCILVVDDSYNIYLHSLQTGATTQLPGTFKAFTSNGYKTVEGNFYDDKGDTTTIIKENGTLLLDTNHVLYKNSTKLLDHVTDFEQPYLSSYPVVIVREDGTTWLFDIYDTEDRLRLSPPQKLTEELMASLNNTNAVSVSKLTISVPNQTYTGKALTPAVTVKDGSKTLKNGTDYTVTYSNNVNAGTGKVTITGKGNYTGSVTKTFAIAKAKQTITGTSTFNKAYGSKAFSLGAKAKGKLTYKSSNTKVATVSSAGKVTIKGTGTATITVNAAATTNYNKAAAKKVTIKVAPKKMAAPTVKAAKKKMTVSWKKDTKATGYQLTYALNSKFTKSKKSVTISKNKTTKKTISKLKSQKTYYVKTRAYKTVGKTKLYGSYSKVKKIKVK